ncbi:MAG TPA: hypothetical protein VM287_04410 [Egibacteraceae bacterium]|nr:hypothetical protein [Egibacteraceae bacterium]
MARWCARAAVFGLAGVLLSGCALAAWADVAPHDPAAVLIESPGPEWVLSPELDGATGPLTAERWDEMYGVGGEAWDAGAVEGGYLRLWNAGERMTVAVALRLRDADVAGMWLDAVVTGSQDAGLGAFPVDVDALPDALGSVDTVGDPPVVMHRIAFRRGRWGFLVTTGAPDGGPELVTALAAQQAERVPGGETVALTAEDVRLGELEKTLGTIADSLGTLIGTLVLPVALVAAVVWTRRRSRQRRSGG